MSVSDELRKEMLRELFKYNATPVAQPGDLTAQDVVEVSKEEGRTISRCQAYRWLNNMVATAGWETELILLNGHNTRVWRKPESSKD